MTSEFFHKDRLTLIVKPTGQCNAKCIYCSAYKGNNNSLKMSDNTLKLMFERVIDYCKEASIKHIEIIWHGGEPLLMKPQFYEKVYGYKSEFETNKITVKHSIQTNLLSFTDNYVPVFNALNMKISSSIDPISGVRLLGNNKDDYLKIWIEKFNEVVRYGFHVGLICILHKKHINHLASIFQFFENLYALSDGKMGLRYNVLYFAGKAKQGDVYDDLSITPEEWGNVLIQLWDRWNRSGRFMSGIQPLAELASLFESHNEGRSCTYCTNCARGWLGIEENGYVYNCGRHMDSGKPFGNIYDASLTDILLNPSRTKLFQRTDLLKKGECKDCPIWEQCYGGCPDDGFLYSGSRMDKSIWCKSYLAFYEKVVNNVE